MSWAEPVETPAGLREPRMVRGLRWPRMVADLPQTTGWTSRRRRRRFSPRTASKDEPRPAEVHCRGSKTRKQKLSKTGGKQTGWKWHRGHCIFWSSILSRMYGGIQERGDVEVRSNTLFTNTEIAGDMNTRMTLILDKDTGNTEDL